MKRIVFLICAVACIFSSCKDDEPPIISFSVSDVSTSAEYTTCTVKCMNESVDGEKVKMRIVLSEEESMQTITQYVMQATSGQLSCSLTKLQSNRQYYFCFELFTDNDQYRLKDIYKFKTKEFLLSSVTTLNAANITCSTAVCKGSVISNGGCEITERGFLWCVENNMLENRLIVDSGNRLGLFSFTLSNLEPATNYCYKAYAINCVDTAYGSIITFTTSAGLPTLTTSEASNITSYSATCGGNITNTGGATVTARGVCWSTSHDPTVSNNHTTNGSGTGNFTSSITGLNPSTTYYVRAYATNSVGTAYGNEVTFTTTTTAPTVTTSTTSNITSTTATCGGNVTNTGGATVTARGVCWSTSHNPTVSNSHTTNGSGTGSFTSSITGLSAGTTYYVRAYATNSAGTAYGNEVTFTTTTAAPTVTTSTASNISSSTATCGGNVTNTGGATVTARGVCWSTSHNPTVSNSHTTNGSGIGSFTSSITGLTPGTTYYVRAYATNSVGTAYGNEVTFTTIAAPTVTTSTASNISSSTATCGGNVTNTGGATVTARGVCWSTTHNPTVSSSHTINGSGTGSFTSSITGLTTGTTYYVRAYATNSAGTAYGNEVTFTTIAAPTVTTSTASNISSTTATCGGNVTNTGGATVTARGVCWSTTHNPTVSSDHTTNGSGTGSFTSSITGLTPGTTYYVRAYATNSVGTAYGNEITFTTTPPTGALPGLFSISATQQVYFSQGNLQYHTTNHQWRFAASQTTVIRTGNSNITSSSGCWIDLFGWGTGNNPTNISSSPSDYSTFVDWGVNAISNGGNQAGQWRTLTESEWDYLRRTRPNASTKIGIGTINGMYGLIILPDIWNTPSSCSFSASSVNSYTTSQWSLMEQAGAVFLPTGGWRQETTIYGLSSDSEYTCVGEYWLNRTIANAAHAIYISMGVGAPYYGTTPIVKQYGLSVRLVQEY